MKHDELCFRFRDVGIKTFCRVGSGTISREITRAQGYDLFMEAPTKVCIVRHPWSRLLSVWFGLFPGGTMPSRGYPACKSLEQLIGHLMNLSVENMEVHTKPMVTQLSEMGWLPKDDELVTIDAFFENPPHGIPKPKVRHHQSPKQPEPEISEFARVRFLNKYLGDLALFERAEKSPLSAGGK